MALRRQLLSLRQHVFAVAEASINQTSTSGKQIYGSQVTNIARLSTLPEQAASVAAAAATGASRRRPTDVSAMARLRALIRDYKQLSKFRLGALVVATSAAGYVAGSDEQIDWKGMGWTCLGTMLASSSANALNQAYEKINDGLMKRTAHRPLPTGRMSRPHALAFAAICGVGGVLLLLEKTNATTAALGAANILLYAGVYTPLKQISVINTWIGAIVGAVPPLMGWAAATGGLDIGAGILGATLYFWQMPHFMALAWMWRADYAAGGYRMLSMIDATGKRTAACALRNCAYLLPLGLLATWMGATTPYFAYESAFITGGMLLTAAKFYSTPSQANARLLFRASLLHLPIFMGAFMLHRKPNTGDDKLELLKSNVERLGFGNGPAMAMETDGRKGGLSEYGEFLMRVQLPPFPFLPLPRLAVQCPSKALCSDEEAEESNEKNQSSEEMMKKDAVVGKTAVLDTSPSTTLLRKSSTNKVTN